MRIGWLVQPAPLPCLIADDGLILRLVIRPKHMKAQSLRVLGQSAPFRLEMRELRGGPSLLDRGLRLVELCDYPSAWITFSLAALTLDFISGSYLTVPILYVIPVLVAAWNRGLKWALPMTVALSLTRTSFNFVWDVPLSYSSISMTIFRGCMLALLAFFVSREASRRRALKVSAKQLTGIVPICSFCKKVRDDKSQWQQVESYISARTEAKFSHTFCPHCAETHYGEFFKR